jgi:hypothetical protein
MLVIPSIYLIMEFVYHEISGCGAAVAEVKLTSENQN